MADPNNSSIDLTNRKEIFIVMHHVESYATPEPMSSNGYNVARTVYVFNEQESAFRYAYDYATNRKLQLGLHNEDSSQGEWRDHNITRLGYGWELRIREVGPAPRLERKVISRELIWVECQWKDKTK